jgi:hypothetical protein
MRSPVVTEGFPPKLYVLYRGKYHRVHHFWIGLVYAVSDLHDWRVWISDLREERDARPAHSDRRRLD